MKDPGQRRLEKKVLNALVLPAHLISKIKKVEYQMTVVNNELVELERTVETNIQVYA